MRGLGLTCVPTHTTGMCRVDALGTSALVCRAVPSPVLCSSWFEASYALFACVCVTLQVVVGEWHEGVIVFPSGDLVVRYNGVLSSVDATIEAVCFNRADVVQEFSFVSCRSRRYLKLYYLGLDARPAVLSICESDLRDNVTTMAAFINGVKARSLTANFV